ncbi:hypothetical protein E2C01_099273 [Portunus trituberculatus]|uniref:Uncharacterized protein n=1 Tax=Portunus trituberculatus TaxID=210409 RepID=A0A5B7K3F4_PORTR|nr:hypothetical protein [Portunus trituberculatus]
MTQPITKEVIAEFEEVLPDIREVIKTRSSRAKKDVADASRQTRGRGRGRGRGQGIGRTARVEAQYSYRDNRWRERGVKE